MPRGRRQVRWVKIGVLAALLLPVVRISPALADQGVSRDLGFGDGGTVVISETRQIGGYQVEAQSDGKIVVAGHDDAGGFIRRYFTDGRVDGGFGVDGAIRGPEYMYKAWIPTESGLPLYVLYGRSYTTFELRRYLPDGAADARFGVDGVLVIVRPDFPSNVTFLVDDFGRVVFGADVEEYDNGHVTDKTLLMRFTQDGQPDRGFGDDGVVTFDTLHSALLGSDGLGRLYLYGQRPGTFIDSIQRVSGDGEFDSAFGDGGFVLIEGLVVGLTPLVYSDGSMAVATAEYVQADMVARVQRFDAEGNVDLEFGESGMRRIGFVDLTPSYWDINEDVAPARLLDVGDGEILLLANSGMDMAAALIDVDGTLDPSFGEEGRALITRDATMWTGTVEPGGAIDTINAKWNDHPVVLQRSFDMSPWPPISPAPANLRATVTDGVLTVDWDPVVNPDPEVVDFGYAFELVPSPWASPEMGIIAAPHLDFGRLPPNTYTVTVRSVNLYADGEPASVTVTVPSPPAPPVVPPEPPVNPPEPPVTSSTGLVTLPPARLLDSRPHMATVDGALAGIGLRPAGVTEVRVAGRGGVPSDATSAVLNVTVTDPRHAGFVTVYPCGTPMPLASNVNFLAGQTVANLVLAGIGNHGKVCVFTNVVTHLLVDVDAAFVGAAALPPARILDSRADGVRGPGTTELQVAGRGGVPVDAAAVVLNVTAVGPAGAGFVTVYPCGEVPLASNLNFGAGQTVANTVLTKVSSEGKVCVYSNVATHLVVDVNGAFEESSDLVLWAPTRLLDTRSHGGPRSGTTQVPIDARAVMLNVTVVGPGAAGFVTVYPCGSPPPLASNVNFVAGQTVANAALAQIGAGGTVCIYSNVTTDLVVDVTAVFNP